MIDTDTAITRSVTSDLVAVDIVGLGADAAVRRPLTELLTRPPVAEQLVAVAQGQPISWQQWRQRVELWQRRLAEHSGDTIAVFLHDSLEFSVVLLALWHSNKVALLTGDCLPATVQQLVQQGLVSGLIGDFPPQDQLPHLQLDPLIETQSYRHLDNYRQSQPNNLRREQLAVIVLTSGSTGQPKPVPFRLGQLDDELAMHEQLWGEQAGVALVVGTVSHQHIYGLLWRVLWPLTGNRPLLSECCHYPEELQNQAQRWQQLILITTPTHLTRLPNNFCHGSTQPWCLVISSTAPLTLDASRIASEQLGVPITEIYGSSETGGIAWRRQTEDVYWQALPGIRVRSESDTGALQLCSPLLDNSADHSTESASAWLTTSDRVELVDRDRFRLLGRLDRIAKVEGKRVSLSAMEQHLLQHPWLDEVAVLVLNGRRTETAVVACLSSEGQKILLALGKLHLNKQLREWLGQCFEVAVLPRRWRMVEQLPRNAQGKLPLAALQALFDASPSATIEPAPVSEQKPLVDSSRLPRILSCRFLPSPLSTPSSVELQIAVSANLIWFDGHFPNAPILPGVVQLHWAAHFAVQYLGTPTALFSRMEVIKFQQVIRPDQVVTLELDWNSQQQKLRFRYYHEQQAFSSGRLVFDSIASDSTQDSANV